MLASTQCSASTKTMRRSNAAIIPPSHETDETFPILSYI